MLLVSAGGSDRPERWLKVFLNTAAVGKCVVSDDGSDMPQCKLSHSFRAQNVTCHCCHHHHHHHQALQTSQNLIDRYQSSEEARDSELELLRQEIKHISHERDVLVANVQEVDAVS